MEILHLNLINITTSLTTDSLLSAVAFFAQLIEDPDVIGQMQDAWNNFIESGQVWALLIGLFIGYSFKGLTSY